MPMKRRNRSNPMLHWWSRYISGAIKNPKQLMEASRQTAEAEDAPFTERFLNMDVLPQVHTPARLVAPSIMTAEHVLRYHQRADWQHTTKDIQRFAASFVETLRKRGVPVYVHSAFRTEAEQLALVKRGVSKARYPRAPHCMGEAVDIVHARYHWEMTINEWAILGKIGHEVADRLSLPIRWGGDWKFYDPAHWEIADWRDRVRHIQSGDPIRQTPRQLKAKLRL